MTAFLFRMPAGIPGDVNRAQAATIETQDMDTTGYATVYGVAVKVNTSNSKVRAVGSGDTATSIYGMLVRPYPTQSSQDPLGKSTPPAGGIVDVMVRGYMTVQFYSLSGATNTTKNGTVYVRVAAGTSTLGGSSSNPFGGIESSADGSGCVAIAGKSYFTGPIDPFGNVEIAFNI